MTKIVEDTIVETMYTKITSYVSDSKIAIAIYSRDKPSEPWEMSNSEYVQSDKFENIIDTLSYLKLKYKSEIGSNKQ
jgi:hypothetical protein